MPSDRGSVESAGSDLDHRVILSDGSYHLKQSPDETAAHGAIRFAQSQVSLYTGETSRYYQYICQSSSSKSAGKSMDKYLTRAALSAIFDPTKHVI